MEVALQPSHLIEIIAADVTRGWEHGWKGKDARFQSEKENLEFHHFLCLQVTFSMTPCPPNSIFECWMNLMSYCHFPSPSKSHVWNPRLLSTGFAQFWSPKGQRLSSVETEIPTMEMMTDTIWHG